MHYKIIVYNFLISCFSFLLTFNHVKAGNTPCTATVLLNDMDEFELFDNANSGESGLPPPDCGTYAGNDIWFKVTTNGDGKIFITTIEGTMTNAALALYRGPCTNLSYIGCTEDDKCGHSIMPITSFEGLQPATTYFIRIWNNFPANTGSFWIRVTNEEINEEYEFNLFRDAVITDDCIQLTEALNMQAGCMWSDELIDFNKPFTHNALLNFSSVSPGGTGIAMVYQANYPPQCAEWWVTGGMAIGNIPNTLIFEFDTWYDPYLNDPFPPNDHTSININGSMNHVNSLQGPYEFDDYDLTNGTYHSITFEWNPINNRYSLKFNNEYIFIGNYDFINNCFGGNNLVSFGFSAATSTSLAFSTQTVCPLPTSYPHGKVRTDSITICEGEFYFAGGQYQTSTGIYTDMFDAENGCDSIVHTELTVLPAGIEIELDPITLCEGECANVAGQQLCATGNFEIPSNEVAGCDSTFLVEITVLKPFAYVGQPQAISCVLPLVQLPAGQSSSGPMYTYEWTGPNGFFSNEQSPFVDVPGMYTLTVYGSQDGVVCESEPFETEVIDNVILPVANAGSNFELDCSKGANYLDGSASDTGPEIIYNWSGPGGFESIVQNPAISEEGMYTLLVLNTSNTCFSVSSVQVTGDLNYPDAMAIGNEINCYSDSVQLYGSCTSDNVSFVWNGPNDFNVVNAEPFVVDTGMYILTVIDTFGCIGTDTTYVNIDDTSPDIIAVGDTVSCAEPVGILTANSQTNGVSFYWKGPGNFESIEQNPTTSIVGNYIAYAIGPNGCEDSLFVSLTSEDNVPQYALNDGSLNCLQSEINIDITSVGDSLEYQWTGPNNFISTDSVPFIDVAGTYFLTITSTDGCAVSDSAIIIEDFALPKLTVSGDTLTCQNDELILNLISQDSIIEWIWTYENGFFSGLQNPLVTEPGIYTCMVVALNGCEDSIQVEIYQNADFPDLSATGNIITCASSTVQIEAFSNTPNVQYSWTGPNGFISNMVNPEVDTSGIYTITVLADNGCSAEMQVEVFLDTIAPLFLSIPQELNCNTPETTLVNEYHSTAYSYQWNGPNNFNSNSNSPLINQAGIYHLTLLGENGCITTDSIEIFQFIDTPFVSIELVDSIDCKSPEGVLEGISTIQGVTYLWTGPEGFNSIDSMPIISTAGDYFLTVTSAFGCTSENQINVLADTSAPIFSVQDVVINCIDTIAILEFTTNSSYDSLVWEGPNNFVSNVQNPQVFNTGAYTLSLINDKNCSASETLELTINNNIPDVNLFGSTLNCLKDSVIISVENETIDWIYNWTGPNGFSDTAIPTTVGDSGLYDLIVLNPENGCSGTESIYIDENSSIPTVSVSFDSINCEKSAATINIQDGEVYWIYEWYGPGSYSSTNMNIVVTTPGDYSLSVTDPENGCVFTELVTIYSDENIPMVSLIGEELNCASTEAEIIVIGGALNWNYNWEGPNSFSSNDMNLNIDVAGNYSLTVSDPSNGCTANIIIAIEEDFEIPMVEILSDDINCENPTASLIVQNGEINWTYDWIGPESYNSVMMNISVQTGGEYTLTVTDPENGCTDEYSILVAQITGPEAVDLEFEDPNCIEQEFGNLFIENIEGGTSPYLFAVDQTENFQEIFTFEQLLPGNHILYVLDAYGCVFENPFTIEEFVPLFVYLPAQIDLIANENIQLQATTNIPPEDILNIEWIPSENLSCSNCLNPILSTSNSGIYTLVLTDFNGCEISATVDIRIEKIKVYIPNVFSPNNDGINDKFFLSAGQDQIADIKHFSIFDRWGNRVFSVESICIDDPDAGWDGRSKNGLVFQGVYTYIATVLLSDGSIKTFSGSVTIIR